MELCHRYPETLYRARYNAKSDHVIHLTVEKCTSLQVVKQPEQWNASNTEEQKCSSFQTNYDEQLITPRGL